MGIPRRNGQNDFQFAKVLDYKLFAALQEYSAGKPILVFCSTRKGTHFLAYAGFFFHWFDQVYSEPLNNLWKNSLNMRERSYPYHGLDPQGWNEVYLDLKFTDWPWRIDHLFSDKRLTGEQCFLDFAMSS